MPIDVFDSRAMTEVINLLEVSPKFFQERVFKKRRANKARTIDVDIVRGGKRILPFASDTGKATIIGKTTRAFRTVKPPVIRVKKAFDAHELLSGRAPGSYIYSGGSPSQYQAQLLATEQQELKEQLARTIEWMCAQALTGKISVDQDDIAFEVDYLFDDTHKPDISTDAALKWNGTAPQIMDNLEEWVNLIEGAGDIEAYMGRNVWKAMYKDTDVRAILDNRRFEGGGLTFDAANYYKGTLNGVKLYCYPESYKKPDGTSGGQFVDDDHIILVATGARFVIEFGLIEDLKAKAQVVGEFFSKSWEEEDASLLWVLAHTCPLPVVYEPDSVIDAKVTA